MRGEHDYDICHQGHRLLVCNKSDTVAYRFTVEEIPIEEGSAYPTTDIHRNQVHPWVGLALALQDMGIIKDDATDTELKATKIHLEDMRQLVFEALTFNGVKRKN